MLAVLWISRQARIESLHVALELLWEISSLSVRPIVYRTCDGQSVPIMGRETLLLQKIGGRIWDMGLQEGFFAFQTCGTNTAMDRASFVAGVGFR